MFLNSFNYFRGISILFIIAGHTYWAAHWYISSFWERWIANLASGGTVLFVFISGFLFHHIFYSRFQYFSFLKKKAQNVLVPYLILSIIPIWYWVFVRPNAGPFAWFMFGSDPGLWDQVLRPILMYLWSGAVYAPWWYIAFIMMMFALSPLHMRFIGLPNRTQELVIVLLLCASVLVHRPVNNLNPFQALLYLSAAYTFGIYCSINRQRLYDFWQGREWYLLAVVIALAGYQASIMPNNSLYGKDMFVWGGIDLMYLQKMLLCVFFMVFLHRFEHVKIPVLEHLAQSSFALYFLHSMVITSFDITLIAYQVKTKGNIFTWIAFTALVTYLTFRLAVMLRRWLGKRSRFFIGW